jgi:hypothetical protein
VLDALAEEEAVAQGVGFFASVAKLGQRSSFLRGLRPVRYEADGRLARHETFFDIQALAEVTCVLFADLRWRGELDLRRQRRVLALVLCQVAG